MSGFSPAAPIVSAPPSGFTALSNVFTRDFTTTFGVVAALTGAVGTQSLTGLKTTDCVTVSCLGTMPAGCIVANVRVSATDTLEITFVTAVVAGVTLGSLSWRVTVLR